MTAPHLDPARRHEALLLFDITDGNPNGDPDADNHPRQDEETGHGLVTDVAIKRKIRDTVTLIHGDDTPWGIFVTAGRPTNERITEANQTGTEDPVGWLCHRYFDIRLFGAVLTGGKGHPPVGVRGPVQLTFARSLDPIMAAPHTIVRTAHMTGQRASGAGDAAQQIGNKWAVPYGLYRQRLYFSAPRAAQTGVTTDDLAALWQAITLMFEHDRSAIRGSMQLCGLWVFSHDTALGNAPANALFSQVQVRKADANPTPRAFDDYRVHIAGQPRDGVTMTTLCNIWADAGLASPV